MDGCQHSRIVGFYITLGDGLEDMEALIVTQHPNGVVTAAPCNDPGLMALLVPNSHENMKRLHELAETERKRRVA